MNECQDMIFEKTYPLIRLRGSGTKAFLHGQTTADFKNSKKEDFTYSCWLNTEGILRAIMEIRLLENGADLLVLGGDYSQLIEEFDNVIFPADQVHFEECLEIRRIQKIKYNDISDYKDSIWLFANESLPDNFYGIQDASYDDYERWRIKNLFPIGKGEINSSSNPFELGIADLIDFDKGCYLGQERIVKLSRSGKVKKQLVSWQSNEKITIGSLLGVPNDLVASSRNLGQVTSSIEDSQSKGSIGLAIIRVSALKKTNLCHIIGNKDSSVVVTNSSKNQL